MAANALETPLKGLLECPLRNSYVEFEYVSGDKVGELRRRLQELWQLPDEPRYGIFMSLHAWAILCRDTKGTYSPLSDRDPLPAKTPAAVGELEPNIAAEASYWRGTSREEHNSNAFLYADPAQLEVAPDSGDVPEFFHEGRFSIKVIRNYKLPRTNYNIQLVALALITGG